MRLPSRLLALTVIVVGLLAGGVVEAQTASSAPDWRDRFRTHDRNGDGRIDRAEFQEWMVDAFFQRDQGKKGYLTIEDVRGVMTPEIFKALNRSGDGKLWLPEYLNALFQDFQAMDTGQEGSVTMEQVDAYVRRALR
jgi:Ca2+-binding EF-hand superfamily protein